MDKIKWRTSQSFPSVGPPHYSTNPVLALPRMRVALLITSPSFAGLHSVSAQRSAVCAKVDTVLSLRAIAIWHCAASLTPEPTSCRDHLAQPCPTVGRVRGQDRRISGQIRRAASPRLVRMLRLPITVGSVASGIKLAQYAIEHYRYVMAATGFVTEIAIADRIVKWCHRDQRRSSPGEKRSETSASRG